MLIRRKESLLILQILSALAQTFIISPGFLRNSSIELAGQLPGNRSPASKKTGFFVEKGLAEKGLSC